MVERKAKQNTNKLSAALPINDAIINDQILISQPHDDVSLFCSLASFSLRFKPNTPVPLCSPSFPLAVFRPRSCSNVFCSCSPLHRQHAHRIDIALSYLTCDTASTVTLQRLPCKDRRLPTVGGCITSCFSPINPRVALASLPSNM